MHEYPVTKKIIETAERYARENGAARVTKIRLTVGDDSGYLADSIELYFELIARGTLCEGARLEIERVRPMLRCEVCGRLFERKPFRFDCTFEGCGGEGTPSEVGREMLIHSIEIVPVEDSND